MAIISSLYTGVSGLTSNGAAIAVIGDNIANANTVGFKASNASFGDILSSTMTSSAGNYQVGRGSQLLGVSADFTQGAFQTTENGLDLAVDGSGFFIVNDPDNASYYTRAGQFDISKEGYLVNPEGYKVQGYQTDSAGNITPALGDLPLSSAYIQPSTTKEATISANLDAGAVAPDPLINPFSSSDSDSYNFSTSITLYDSLGNARNENLYFVKSATAGTWDVYAPGSTSGNSAIGSLVFDVNGNIDTAVPGNTGSLDATFDYGAGLTIGGLGAGSELFDLSEFSQYTASSTILTQYQDGYPSGSLRNVSIDPNGVISGRFSNGKTKALGQIALATFQNQNGLFKSGNNLFKSSLDSGQASVGTPATGQYGKVLSSSLELSNVDLTREFVKLITIQRGFQANSKIITTSDEMLTDLLNTKR